MHTEVVSTTAEGHWSWYAGVLGEAVGIAGAVPAHGFFVLSRDSWMRGWRIDLWTHDRGKAEALARSLARKERYSVVGKATSVSSPGTMDCIITFEALRYVRPMDLSELVTRAYGVEKAAWKILNPSDPVEFAKWQARLARELNKQGTGILKEVMADVRASLRRWKPESMEAVRHVTRDFNKAVASSVKAATPGINTVTTDGVVGMATGAKKEIGQKYAGTLGYSLEAAETEAAKRMGSWTGHYVRDAYGELSVAGSEQARQIASEMLREGAPATEIGNAMMNKMALALNRSRPYFQVVSNAMLGRSRSYGQLAGYREGGFQRYKIVAVLDEKTTNICRYMDGKELSVQGGLSRYEQVERARSPTAITYEMPWTRERTIKSGDDEGKRELYVVDGKGEETRIAVVERSGKGTADDTGDYSSGLTGDALEAAHMGPPPYHGSCRTTTVAL